MKKMDDSDLKKVDGGSRTITVRSQTFKKAKSGSHTIKAKKSSVSVKKSKKR